MAVMVLYKYLKRKHAISLVTLGEIYIQTLNNLLEIEDDSIRDEEEGKLSSIMDGHILDPKKPESITPQFSRIMKSGKIQISNGSLTIRGNLNEVTNNCFIYSTSLVLDKILMQKLGKDTCVIIKDHKKFVHKLNKCMIKKFKNIHGPIIGKVEYINKTAFHTSQTGTLPIFTKAKEFQSEIEYRIVWDTDIQSIHPEPIICSQLTKLVEIIEI